MHTQPDLLASQLPTTASMSNTKTSHNTSSCTIHNFRKLGKAATCVAGVGATNCDRYIAPLCGLDPDSILGNIITGGAFSIPLHASLIAGMLEVNEHSTKLASVHESFQLRFMEFVEKVDVSRHLNEEERKALLALAKISQDLFQEIIDEQKEKHNATIFYITTLSTMAVLTALAMAPATVILPFLSTAAAHVTKGIIVTGIGALPILLQARITHHYQDLFYKAKDFPAQFEAWTYMLDTILANEEHPQYALLTSALEKSGISTKRNKEIYTHLSTFISGLYSLDTLTLLNHQNKPRTASMGSSSRSTHHDLLRNLSTSSLRADTPPSSPENSLESPTHHVSSATPSASILEETTPFISISSTSTGFYSSSSGSSQRTTLTSSPV